MTQTNADLRRYYRTANRLYFQNRLPQYMPVLFGKVHRGSLAVTHVLTFKGVTVVVDVTISEELRTIQNTTIMTLLHEMLHVEQPRPQGHGWRFDRRMLKLAKAGAFNGLW